MLQRQYGFTSIELLVVLVVLLLILGIGVNALFEISGDLRLRMAAAEIASTLRLARSWAIRHNRRVAVKYRIAGDGTVRFGLYRDGDGDGVRNLDIDSGTDPVVAPLLPLGHLGGKIRFGFPPGIHPPDPGNPQRRLDRLEDPIRFNQSDLASFDPLGTATPGTVYLTDGSDRLAAVRVNHRSARVRIFVYDADEDAWR